MSGPLCYNTIKEWEFEPYEYIVGESGMDLYAKEGSIGTATFE